MVGVRHLGGRKCDLVDTFSFSPFLSRRGEKRSYEEAPRSLFCFFLCSVQPSLGTPPVTFRIGLLKKKEGAAYTVVLCCGTDGRLFFLFVSCFLCTQREAWEGCGACLLPLSFSCFMSLSLQWRGSGFDLPPLSLHCFFLLFSLPQIPRPVSFAES